MAAIGQRVDLGDMLKGTAVRFTKKGTVEVDKITLQTDESDIFAGGDIVTGPRFAIDAIAAGKEASISIHRFVHEGQSLVIGRAVKEYLSIDKDEARVAVRGLNLTARQKAAEASPAEAVKTFHDLRGSLTEEQMKKETERCLGCGAVVLDEYMCVGCGICTTKCKFDAIQPRACPRRRGPGLRQACPQPRPACDEALRQHSHKEPLEALLEEISRHKARRAASKRPGFFMLRPHSS